MVSKMQMYVKESLAVFQSGLFQTNSAVLITKDLVLVTDPGYLPSEIDAIRSYVDQVKGDRPVYLFFTHSNYDHIAGYGAFAECSVIAGLAFNEQTGQHYEVERILKMDDDLYINRPYKIEYPRVDHVIRKEGESLVVGDTILTFYTAYGHNSDGIMCLVEQSQILITGDYLSDIEFPFVYDSFVAYRNTLSTMKRIAEQYPGLLLLPGHGSVTDQPEEILHRIMVSEQYLELTENLLLHPDEEKLQRFMDDNRYSFKRVLVRRHEDNMNVLVKEKAEKKFENIQS
jgi:hydroxyacylglutathione hydrolase